MSQCYRRFSHPVYLLTCELETGHKGEHKDGEYGWAAGDGFDDEYMGAPIKYDPDRVQSEPVLPPGNEPDDVALEEVRSLYGAPKFSDGSKATPPDRVLVAPKGLEAYKNLSIAARLAERKAINASLTKKQP